MSSPRGPPGRWAAPRRKASRAECRMAVLAEWKRQDSCCCHCLRGEGAVQESGSSSTALDSLFKRAWRNFRSPGPGAQKVELGTVIAGSNKI